MKTGIYWQDPKYAVGWGSTDPGCVLHLPLHRLDGASFMSKDAYGHLCTVTGALWTPRGRSFDGTDDYINCGRDSNLDVANLTVEAWIYLELAPTGGQGRTIVSKYDREYELHIILVSGEYRLCLYLGDGTNYDNYDSGFNISLNTWYYAAAVADGANVRLYINGALVKTLSQLKAIGVRDTDLIVGKRSPSGEVYGGIIGEVSIHNRALTPIEIQHRYLATKRREE